MLGMQSASDGGFWLLNYLRFAGPWDPALVVYIACFRQKTWLFAGRYKQESKPYCVRIT